MARIEDLVPDIGQMNTEELQAKILEIRNDRKKSKKVQKTTTPRKRKKATDQLAELLMNMTPKQRNEFLANLKKEQK